MMAKVRALAHDDFRRRMHDNHWDDGHDDRSAIVPSSAFCDQASAGGEEGGNAG